MQAGCGCNALEKQVQGKRMADASGKLASQQRWRQGLLNACKESTAGDRVWGVEDCTSRVHIVFNLVKVLVVSVVCNVVAMDIVQALLAEASLGAAVLTVSLLSKQPLGVCWARH
jgi:hypothetical protein